MSIRKIPLYCVIVLTFICYVLLGYFTNRENFFQFISLYVILFGSYLYFLWHNKKFNSLTLLLIIGIVFRLAFLLATPSLSNDYFRFIWDGRLAVNGLNPYLTLPNELAATDDFLRIHHAQTLYEGMGTLSQENYSCYPPVHQFFFFISSSLFPNSILGSVAIMRLLIILAEIGTFVFGMKILSKMNLPCFNILFYALNPFIIVELTGNLHFEGIMIFFFLLSLYLLMNSKNLRSAIFLALSVSVKLIPLIFLPLFFKRLRWQASLKYYAIVGSLSLFLFFPFFNLRLVQNFMTSINLYFQKFEFNASCYYLVREVGYYFAGHNVIQTAGWVLAALTFLFVIIFALRGENKDPRHLFISMLLVLSIYYFLSTTVHPWYISTVLILSIFTRFRYVLLWSLMIMLSYYAYRKFPYVENLWFVLVEYLAVYGYLAYEIFSNKMNPFKKKSLSG